MCFAEPGVIARKRNLCRLSSSVFRGYPRRRRVSASGRAAGKLVQAVALSRNQPWSTAAVACPVVGASWYVQGVAPGATSPRLKLTTSACPTTLPTFTGTISECIC